MTTGSERQQGGDPLPMDLIRIYPTPLGVVTLASDGEALTGLWFEGQAHFGAGLRGGAQTGDAAVFAQTARWLEQYFRGEEPDACPPLAPRGTAFQLAVWAALRGIPRGEVRTYGELAALLSTSARAVGGAVARNPISLLIPCHRVVGAHGALTGYAGGLARKRALLEMEGCTWR